MLDFDPFFLNINALHDSHNVTGVQCNSNSFKEIAGHFKFVWTCFFEIVTAQEQMNMSCWQPEGKKQVMSVKMKIASVQSLSRITKDRKKIQENNLK